MKVRGLEKIEEDALEVMILAAEPAPGFLAQALTVALRAEKKRREAGGRAEEVEIDLTDVTSEALVGFQIAVQAQRKVFARGGWIWAAACCSLLALEANAELTRRTPASAQRRTVN